MDPDSCTSKQLFERVIQMWGARPDPSEELTLNQIAHIVLGLGSARNARIIGRMMFEFRDYFHHEDGSRYRCNVRWKAIERDHPALFPKSTATASTIPDGDAITDMMQALRDEVLAIRKQCRDHPIRATVSKGLGQMPDGGFWYDAHLDLPADTDLPVPDGVEIKLRWSLRLHVFPCDAKLLSYHPIKSTIIFETEQPLATSQIANEFEIHPNIEQLVDGVSTQLASAETHKERPVWRILKRAGSRENRTWTGAIPSSQLDLAQAEAVNSCLTHDITYLWGPPGTGKTYTLGRLIASAAISGKRVIAAAISNIAVDQISVQAVDALGSAMNEEGTALLTGGRVMRFGHPRDPNVTGEIRLFPNKIQIQQLRKELHELLQRLRDVPETDSELRASLQHRILAVKSQLRRVTKLLLNDARVVLTTAVQACIEPAIGQSSFDLAVIDEASMMPIPYLVCVGALADQVIITGDFRQLGPIALSQTAASYRWLHKDPFELAGISGDSPQHPALKMLKTQRRMHPRICDLINRPFYGGTLQSEMRDSKASSLEPLPGEPAVFISILPRDGSAVEQTPTGSRLNRKSAELVADLVCEYFDAASNSIIGIIAPYRAQVTYIRRLLRDRSVGLEQWRRVRLGTVHGFQGSEADVIIWDLVETTNHKIGRLYCGDNGDRLTNVAISRARSKLVLVGDPNAFFKAPGSESVRRLRAILTANFYPSSPLVVPARVVAHQPIAACG